MCFVFCKEGILYYCICSMYFKYPLTSKEKESTSSSSETSGDEKGNTMKNVITDVEMVDEETNEECLTPVYLGTSSVLQTPHVQKDDPDEQLDL